MSSSDYNNDAIPSSKLSNGKQVETTSAKFWYSNAIFFIGTHIAACLGAYKRPLWDVPRETLLLAFFTFQAAEFGITVGYHRLYSHRAFRASWPVRIVLAALGSMGFQGSIKVFGSLLMLLASTFFSPKICSCSSLWAWAYVPHSGGAFGIVYTMFTDDPVHDPYAATRGLLFSHMGWIFFKPNYEKMSLIERDDLDNDLVARFQHKYYVPIAFFMGFVLPTLIGCCWNDPSGAFIWAGLVARIVIWHCTFFVNSLAHWDGLQPYSDENTSRGNLILAVLTCGEGNHNFHAFPHDFRSGPSPFTWDPSKWIILALHRLKLASGLRQAREDDIRSAEAWMKLHGGHAHHFHPQVSTDSYDVSDDNSPRAASDFPLPEADMGDVESEWNGEDWDKERLAEFVREKPGRCVVVIDGYAIDVTKYLGEHPGGASLLREYSERPRENDTNLGRTKKLVSDASTAFHGGMNKHSRAAKRRMHELRVARVISRQED